MTDGMTDGLLLSPGAGRRIETAGMTLKVGAEHTPRWSMFEAEVPMGFDVGAHLHREAEEVFYVLEGELDLLAFEPLERTPGDWRTWESRDGRKTLRGGPGSAMYVPAGCPHAFGNPGPAPARLLFLVAPAGHEEYLAEMGELLASGDGPPPADGIAALRLRYDIEQLTPLVPGRRP
ncbi:cupin domain-containing protein [Streptomyces endophyticus]|uniref:Cupin domain-containing protein n=1 Tax=Streptomyces endophyticus TaxID=714166 RepID=A0ABU6F1M2_9ACTN|nr:cupin domain-containing protein [Streptomyces endophyticus]MEB8336732.1 cupin domain-containing protein [Streptomyces endophyticus]